VEDPVKGIKRQATDWEKMFENHVSDKEEYLENIKISKLNNKKKKSIQLRHGQKKERFTKDIYNGKYAHEKISNIISL